MSLSKLVIVEMFVILTEVNCLLSFQKSFIISGLVYIQTFFYSNVSNCAMSFKFKNDFISNKILCFYKTVIYFKSCGFFCTFKKTYTKFHKKSNGILMLFLPYSNRQILRPFSQNRKPSGEAKKHVVLMGPSKIMQTCFFLFIVTHFSFFLWLVPFACFYLFHGFLQIWDYDKINS